MFKDLFDRFLFFEYFLIYYFNFNKQRSKVSNIFLEISTCSFDHELDRGESRVVSRGGK